MLVPMRERVALGEALTMRTTRRVLLLIVVGLVGFAPAVLGQTQPKEGDKKDAKDAAGLIAGKNFKQWRDELRHPDVNHRQLAIRTIIGFGSEASAAVREGTSNLINCVRDQDANVRADAAMALGLLAL